MEEIVLVVDDHVAEAGRFIMSQQLANILIHEEGVRANAGVTDVHEMRKSIRRTFTCFKLFRPYFEDKHLKRYRRGLRRIMRLLGYSRDLAVFRMNLEVYNGEAEQPLEEFSTYWEARQRIIDDNLMRFLAKPKWYPFFADYKKFTETQGLGVIPPRRSWDPVKFRHHIPILVYQRVAGVRAFDDKLSQASVAQLHRLRIQFKDLRYSLQYFVPLLGNEIENALLNLKQSQQILGDLNDTSVALNLLDGVEGLEDSVARYRAFQQSEQERLVQSFLPVWQEFDQLQWRLDLAQAVVLP